MFFESEPDYELDFDLDTQFCDTAEMYGAVVVCEDLQHD